MGRGGSSILMKPCRTGAMCGLANPVDRSLGGGVVGPTRWARRVLRTPAKTMRAAVRTWLTSSCGREASIRENGDTAAGGSEVHADDQEAADLPLRSPAAAQIDLVDAISGSSHVGIVRRPGGWVTAHVVDVASATSPVAGQQPEVDGARALSKAQWQRLLLPVMIGTVILATVAFLVFS